LQAHVPLVVSTTVAAADLKRHWPRADTRVTSANLPTGTQIPRGQPHHGILVDHSKSFWQMSCTRCHTFPAASWIACWKGMAMCAGCSPEGLQNAATPQNAL